MPDDEPPADGAAARVGMGSGRPAPSRVTSDAGPGAARSRGVAGTAAPMARSSEEAAWVARARTGDRGAFAEIYARYERRIYAFVYRTMGNPEDACDLTQETFLKAYRALDRTNDELNVNAWLHRIAANTCLDVLRRRQ